VRSFRRVQQKGMFAFEISEKIHCFALFFVFLGKFLMIFKKIFTPTFQIFCKDYTWLRLLSRTTPSHLPLFWGW